MLVFAATEALPGGAAVAKLGRQATPEAIAAFQSLYHLNHPVYMQYVLWLGDVVRGHLGISLSSGLPVTRLIGQRIVNSFVLLLAASVIGIPIGVLVGCASALKRDGHVDRLATIAVLTLAALPEFVVGVALILLLATNVVHVFPAASLLNPGEDAWSQLNAVALPAFTLAIAIIPYVARMSRASMIEALESEYVAMARLSGIREVRVVTRYALVNAAGPTLQAIALSLAYLIGGTVVVETVFQYPGIGLALVSAIQNRDLPVVQALVLLIALVYIVVTMCADIVTVALTPRLRTQLR
jgi:peptide/nickel transport system permease protein